MTTPFSKSLETWTSDDLLNLAGWPETILVEYKSSLPARDGRCDAWLNGGRVEAYAKDKIFKELVAFANSAGGMLFIGIAESQDADSGSVAGEVCPVPRCAMLADQLSRAAAQLIDPPIPLLLVHYVALDGDAGVVIFKVPASRLAPHRASDKECYIRRGTESLPMSMREISDMVISGLRKDDLLFQRFKEASDYADYWFSLPWIEGPSFMGLRITAVPASGNLTLGRLYNRRDLYHYVNSYQVLINERPASINTPARLPTACRPFLRGARWTEGGDNLGMNLDLFSNGVVDFRWKMPLRESGQYLLLDWLIVPVINILRTVERLRLAAEHPDLEYVLEVEVRRGNPGEEFHLLGFGTRNANGLSRIGSGLMGHPLTLPKLSFGPISEMNQLVSIIVNDMCDAAGALLETPSKLEIRLP